MVVPVGEGDLLVFGEVRVVHDFKELFFGEGGVEGVGVVLVGAVDGVVDGLLLLLDLGLEEVLLARGELAVVPGNEVGWNCAFIIRILRYLVCFKLPGGCDPAAAGKSEPSPGGRSGVPAASGRSSAWRSRPTAPRCSAQTQSAADLAPRSTCRSDS